MLLLLQKLLTLWTVFLFIHFPDHKVRGSLKYPHKKIQKIAFNPLLQIGTVEYYLVNTFVN